MILLYLPKITFNLCNAYRPPVQFDDNNGVQPADCLVLLLLLNKHFMIKNITLLSESGILVLKIIFFWNIIESLQNGTEAYRNIIIQNGYLIIKPQILKYSFKFVINEEKVLVLYSILLWDARPTHEKTNTHTLPPSLTHTNGKHW